MKTLGRTVTLTYGSDSPIGGTDSAELANFAEQLNGLVGLKNIKCDQDALHPHLFHYSFKTQDNRTFAQVLDMTVAADPTMTWDVQKGFREVELIPHRVFRALCISFIIRYDLKSMLIKYDDT